MTPPPPASLTDSEIARAAGALGPGPLTEEALIRHVHPLFSRVLTHKDIYLANHSLGRPLDRTAQDVAGALDLWYGDMDEAWGPWMDEISRFRAGIAALIGLSRPDAVVPRPGAGQGLRAVLNSLPKQPPTVVATRGEFDSLDFILKVYQQKGRARVRWVEPGVGGVFHADSIIDAIDESVNLVVASHVFFSSGQVLDGVDRIAEAAHDCGALALLDLYHSAGVLPISFDEIDPDFALGGSYKYTRGGPGAGWLAINPRHLNDPSANPRATPPITPLDTGWFAKHDVFAFARGDRPVFAAGGDAWLEGTPVVLTAYQAKAGLDLILALGVERLRAYSLEQQAFLIDRLRAAGVPVRTHEPHGAFVLVPSPDAPALCTRLRAAGVIADARTAPDGQGCLRLGPDILNTRAEMARAAEILGPLCRTSA